MERINITTIASVIHIGLDVHAESIGSAVAEAGDELRHQPELQPRAAPSPSQKERAS
jgi:hypothetical protein